MTKNNTANTLPRNLCKNPGQHNKYQPGPSCGDTKCKHGRHDGQSGNTANNVSECPLKANLFKFSSLNVRSVRNQTTHAQAQGKCLSQRRQHCFCGDLENPA